MNKKTVELDMYLVVEFAYDSKFILPLQEGLSVIELLAQGKKYKKEYNKSAYIRDIKESDISMQLLPKSEYEEIQLSQVLGEKNE